MSEQLTVNQIKSHNISLVRHALLETLMPATKQAMARETGLSTATCGTILNELCAAGEITEAENPAPSFGRPPKAYRLNENHCHILCIILTCEDDIRTLQASVTDLRGSVRKSVSETLPAIGSAEILRACLREKAADAAIGFLALGIPGYYYDGCVRDCGLPELNGCPLASLLEEETGLGVLISNDMNTMAYGIWRFHRDLLPNPGDFALIGWFRGRFPGAGILLDGRIHLGSTAYAGQIGDLTPMTAQKLAGQRGEPEAVICETAEITAALCTTVNPANIMYTGMNFTEEMLPALRDRLLQRIPEAHLPALLYGADFMDYYVRGLSALGLDALWHV